MRVEYSKKMIIAILTYYKQFYNRSILLKHPEMVVLKADIDIALEQLNEEQREVILKYYSEGIDTNWEVGECLGIHPRTASYRRNSAINKLYKILNERSDV